MPLARTTTLSLRQKAQQLGIFLHLIIVCCWSVSPSSGSHAEPDALKSQWAFHKQFRLQRDHIGPIEVERETETEEMKDKCWSSSVDKAGILAIRQFHPDTLLLFGKLTVSIGQGCQGIYWVNGVTVEIFHVFHPRFYSLPMSNERVNLVFSLMFLFISVIQRIEGRSGLSPLSCPIHNCPVTINRRHFVYKVLPPLFHSVTIWV